MDIGLSIFALMIAIFGPIIAVAYRRDTKWPRVRDVTWPVFVMIALLGLGTGFGAFLQATLAQHQVDIVTPAIACCLGALALLIAIGCADWLRKP